MIAIGRDLTDRDLLSSGQLLGLVEHFCLQLIKYTEREDVYHIDIRVINCGVIDTNNYIDENAIKKYQPARRIGFADSPHRPDKKSLR